MCGIVGYTGTQQAKGILISILNIEAMIRRASLYSMAKK